MARRMSRFIHFAMATAKEAIVASGIDFAAMSQDERDRVGVVMNTGGGGLEQVIDGRTLTISRRARGSSAHSPSPRCRRLMGADLLHMEYGLTGPVMTQTAACVRPTILAFHDALRLVEVRRCGRRPGRGPPRGPGPPDGARGAREHGRPLEAQRRSGARLAPLRPRPRRLRPRRGRRDGGRRVARARARAERDADRRNHRRRPDRRRVPHQRARAHRARPDARDAPRGPPRRGARRPTRWTTSSPTAPRPPSTT